MNDFIGFGNCLMLLGLTLLVFHLVWIILFGIMHTWLAMTGKPRIGIAAVFILVWGYFLIAQTQAVLLQARLVRFEPDWAYSVTAIMVLLLYVVADRMGAVWVAERKLDPGLIAMTHRLHWLAGVLFLYGVTVLIYWPDFAILHPVRPLIRLFQKLLVMPFFGLVAGVFGLFFLFRLVMRVVRFIQIGPKGMPPFPESLR